MRADLLSAKRFSRLREQTTGTALLEFTIAFPLFFLLLAFLCDFGYVCLSKNTLNSVVTLSAQYAAKEGDNYKSGGEEFLDILAPITGIKVLEREVSCTLNPADNRRYTVVTAKTAFPCLVFCWFWRDSSKMSLSAGAAVPFEDPEFDGKSSCK